ncbi:hypothetical protein ES708_15462 [subsurface metagenome]
MRTLAQRRIIFLSQKRSDSWIAGQTGIPRSSVGYVRRGERSLSPAYNRLLRNTYQREAYGRMRETGFSATQARRFSRYAAESVSVKIGEMKLLVNKFTLGAVGMETVRLKREGISYDIDDLWDDMKQKIIKGLQESRESVEEFADPDY